MNNNEIKRKVPFTVCNECYQYNYNQGLNPNKNCCCPLLDCKKCNHEYCAYNPIRDTTKAYLCVEQGYVTLDEELTKEPYLNDIDTINKEKLEKLSEEISRLAKENKYDFSVDVDRVYFEENVQKYLKEHSTQIIEIFINELLEKQKGGD